MPTPTDDTVFRLKTLRPVLIDGRRLATGVELHTDAVTTRDWITSGRARLVDERDLARLMLTIGQNTPQMVTR